MSRLMLIGGGGFAKETLEIAELCGHQVVGYVGGRPDVLDRPYFGMMDTLTEWRDRFDTVAISFGAVDRKSLGSRAKVVEWITAQGFASIPLISPYAVRAKGARIADGAIIGHGAILSVDRDIGSFGIVNSCAIIGHDTITGRNVTVGPGAFAGGRVTIGDNTLLGPGTIVLQGRSIGSNVVVGTGATVLKDVAGGATVMPLYSRVI
jgi:sugar O-acyltransferase (sialic acid O-acetyltransferase NeuD family)